MLSPLETGTTRGRPRERGRSRETGPRAGTWPRRAARGAAKARQLASGRGEAGQGPSISYMEGPCLILPGRNVFARAGTPATPECQPRRSGVRTQHGRVLGRPRPGAVSAGAAAPATDPCRTVGALARKAGCRAVARAASARPDRMAADPGSDGRRSRRARCGNDSGPGQAACGDRGSCGQLPGRVPVVLPAGLPSTRAGQGTGRQRDASGASAPASAVAGR